MTAWVMAPSPSALAVHQEAVRGQMGRSALVTMQREDR